MNNNIKISIIVPVYNVEKYLRECLDSLINQTLEDIEIICVNDGSTDSSPQILEEYASKDSRIKIFNQKNQGVSSAYNNGIKQVKGKYFTIVDSDDWIREDSCELLYETIEKRKSDILLFAYIKYQNDSFVKDRRLEKLEEFAEGGNIKFSDYYEDFIKGPLLSCGKLYRTDFIHKNNVLFPLNIQCCEDIVFSTRAYINAESISILDTGLYYYRINVLSSLTKNTTDTMSHTYEVAKILKETIYSSDKIKNKDDIYHASLYDIIESLLYYFYSSYNVCVKKDNIKYIRLIKKEYKKYSKKNEESMAIYKKLENTIKHYNKLFIKKLFEPVLEIENRTDRIILYLFERQIFNFNIGNIKNKLLRFKYFLHVLKLRFIAKFRKIKVAFLFYETENWYSIKNLYKEFQKSKYFEPVMYLTASPNTWKNRTNEEFMEMNCKLFDSDNVNYEKLYNTEESSFLPIEDFKCDIIFYQQPWGIDKEQNVLRSAKFALTCYVPYCFYSLKHNSNYFRWFHKKLWKYFVETPYHKKEYEKEFGANNCVAIGSTKFDNYQNINIKKTDKKTIIYAPHHSVEDNSIHRMGTFLKNGEFILDLAKKHPEINWVFRPHPSLPDRLIKLGIKTKEEIKQYYSEWEKIGKVSLGGDNYYEQFMLSDCLITDCISFLSEYLPTGNPVLHLRSERQKDEYNDIVKKITDSYYKIYTNEELEKTFNEVIVQGNDYMKDERQANIKLLMIDENKTTAEKIVDYIKKELRIK